MAVGALYLRKVDERLPVLAVDLDLRGEGAVLEHGGDHFGRLGVFRVRGVLQRLGAHFGLQAAQVARFHL